MATANFIICLLNVELFAYKTEDICQLMIDGFPKKYQVRYKLTCSYINFCFVCLLLLHKIKGITVKKKIQCRLVPLSTAVLSELETETGHVHFSIMLMSLFLRD